MQKALVTITEDWASTLVVNHYGHPLWDWVFQVPVMRPTDRRELEYAVEVHGVDKNCVIAALDRAWLDHKREQETQDEQHGEGNAPDAETEKWPPD